MKSELSKGSNKFQKVWILLIFIGFIYLYFYLLFNFIFLIIGMETEIKLGQIFQSL